MRDSLTYFNNINFTNWSSQYAVLLAHHSEQYQCLLAGSKQRESIEWSNILLICVRLIY